MLNLLPKYSQKYKFREITMAHQNLDTFKSVISQVVPIGVLNQLQITKLIVSAPHVSLKSEKIGE